MTKQQATGVPPHALDELERRSHRSAGRQQVVDQQHAAAVVAGVHVDLDRVGAVLELVGLAGGLPGQLPGLADWHEALAELERQGRPEDEAAGFDAAHDVVGVRVDRGLEAGDRGRQPLGIAEERGDVLEHDPRLGEVGHVPDVALDQRSPPGCSLRPPRGDPAFSPADRPRARTT